MVIERFWLDINLTLTTNLRLMAKSIDIACTLGMADLAAQGRRWQRLMARTLTGRAETADGLRLTFRPEAEDELRALIAVETGCCAWAAWTVEPAAGAVVLDVRSADEGIATLHGMFTTGRSAGRTSASSPGRGHRESRQ
jgi:hypothetical protein